MADDYYSTLGVSKDASDAEIQKAYRELARKYHPDLNPDDKSAKEKFQKVQRAFEVLSDKEKRQMYDRYGPAFEQMGAGAGAGAGAGGGGPYGGFAPGGGTFTWSSGEGGGFDFSDLFGGGTGTGAGGGFEDLLRQFSRGASTGTQRGGGRARRARGADLTHEIHVPFQTAIEGGQIELGLERPSGKRETVTVRIPAGIEDGTKMRLRGQGEAGGRGGPAGDLLLTVRVDEHPHFQRRGKNLYLRVPVSLAEAALGAKIEVPAPSGVISVMVPPGSSSGTKLRIRGQGVPSEQGRGDLIVELQVALPKNLDPESLEAIRGIDQRNPLQPRAGLRW